MMIVRRMIPIAACTLAAVAAAPVPRLAAQTTCPSAAAADTTEWRRVPAGNFSLRLPGSYRGTRMQRIDAAVRSWSAPRGRRVRSEYGSAIHVGSGTPIGDPKLVCDRGMGDTWRMVAYEERGVFGIAYFGLDPSEEGRALVLTAESPRREDLPELLAIIRSLHWAGRPPFQQR